MLNSPEAFLLLSLPDATLKSTDIAEVGVLNLERVTLPIPEAKSAEERTVHLVLRLNNREIPIDPDRVIERKDVTGTRTYTFAETPSDPTHLTLTLKGPWPASSDIEFVKKLDTFDNILEQHVVNYKGPSTDSVASISSTHTAGIGSVTSNKDFCGHLVMIDEDTREVVGEVERRFKIREDPVMYEKDHENEPVIIEVTEKSNIESGANALEAFVRMVPPDQQKWITKSTTVVSDAISGTTNLIVTTIETASSDYISRSTPFPHRPGTPTSGTSSTSRGGALVSPPLPAGALAFLTSEKTQKGLSTVHAMSGQAVKLSTKTTELIDRIMHRSTGAKYFPHDAPTSGPSLKSLKTTPLSPPRTPLSSPSSSSTLPPPSGETQPRLTTMDHFFISADHILSIIDHSARRVLDTGTEEMGKVINHKYGPEAARSAGLIAETGRNVVLVYVDMQGRGHRAILRPAVKTFIKARM